MTVAEPDPRCRLGPGYDTLRCRYRPDSR